MIVISAICFASSTGLKPGRGNLSNRASKPSRTKHMRIFYTEGSVTSRAWRMF